MTSSKKFLMRRKTVSDEDKIGDVPEETAKKLYANGLANGLLGINKEEIENSAAVNNWVESMKEFWSDPVKNLMKAEENHEEKIKKHREQIEKKKKMIEKKKQYIKNHKKAINTIEARIKNLELNKEE